jgi:PKD repeat protein
MVKWVSRLNFKTIPKLLLTLKLNTIMKPKLNYINLSLLLSFFVIWWTCSLEKIEPSVKFDPCLGKVTAKFSHDKLGVSCDSPCVVKFTNNSTGANSYAWDFGEGGKSTEANPTYTYKKAGRFDVKLSVKSDEGCNASYMEVVTVSAPNLPDPIPDFDISFPNGDIAPATVTFRNISQNADSYKWNFATGNSNDISNLKSPQFTFLQNEDYNVTLEAINKVGKVKTITKTVSIKATTFSKTYGNVGYTVGFDIEQFSNGSYIIVGQQSAAGSPNMYMNYIDDKGVSKWYKELFLSSWGIGSYGKSVTTSSNGDIVSFGYSLNAKTGGYDMFLVQYNPLGSEVRRDEYGGNKSEMGNSIFRTKDNGYLLCGSTNSKGKGKEDVYVLKVNSVGILEKEIVYGDTTSNIGIRAIQTNDGNIAILAKNEYQYTLTRTDIQGNILSTKILQYGVTSFGALDLNDMKLTDDGGLIFCGTNEVASGNRDIIIIKTDNLGNVQTGWPLTFGSIKQDEGYSIQQCKNGGYIFCGVSYFQNSRGDAYLLRIDSRGNKIFERRITLSNRSIAYSVKQTNDGGFVITGTAAADSYDYVYIIKTDRKGEIQ